MLIRPAFLLRVEESCLLTASVAVYAHFHFRWLLFGALFFAPDLFMLGYLASVRVGTAMYNFGHFLSVPVALFAFAWAMRQPHTMAISIIWFGHIVFDRMLGYGLKYPSAFKDTHLQRIS